MSFLAPLYVLGALGISLPILFHLIKRQPRGQRAFSSLMFLRPTPPSVTKRSRLDHWPLLLLRALALLLLAAAFARPYLRDPSVSILAAPGKRLVILIDTSASMRRSGLWEQATKAATKVIDDLQAADQIAIVAFDAAPRIEMSLDQSASLEIGARKDSARKAIEQLQPTWATGNLGGGMIFAADLLATHEAPADTVPNANDATAASPSINPADGFVVVISDMQTGGEENLKRLQAYSWPQGIKVDVRPLVTPRTTNAYISLLATRDDDADVAEAPANSEAESASSNRIRISNSSDADKANFTVVWQTRDGSSIESTRLPVHVGPGENRVLKMPQVPTSVSDTTALKLVLEGDDHDFDNVRYVARPKPLKQQLLFVGPESAEARDSLLYYLQRAPLDNRTRQVTVDAVSDTGLPDPLTPQDAPLVVVTQAIDDAALSRLRTYLSSGGNVLVVLDQSTQAEAMQRALRSLTQTADLTISESEVKDYAMWSRIDFSHPLFMPLADPQYNDFTKIRFWSHRKLEGLSDDWKSIVTFDDGDLALAQRSIDKGNVWLLTAGWQPRDSQLALSTKFIPLLDGLFRLGSPRSLDNQSLAMGDKPPFEPSPTARIESDGVPAIDYGSFDEFASLEIPGFYRFIDGTTVQPFALNVAESESRTTPLLTDDLERNGVAMGALTDPVSELAIQRQQRDVELEGQQRLWQTILLAVLGLIGIESALSGLLRRRKALN